jgi:hypothetical protein
MKAPRVGTNVIVEPAPDSAFVTNTPKTPSSILSTKNTDKKDVHKSSRKTPISKKKLHFNLDTIQEDRSSCSDDFPDLPDLHCPDLHCPFTTGNKSPAEDVTCTLAPHCSYENLHIDVNR